MFWIGCHLSSAKGYLAMGRQAARYWQPWATVSMAGRLSNDLYALFTLFLSFLIDMYTLV